MDATRTLTAFEHLMFADDRPEYPMTFFLRARFGGTVDPVRLRAAAAKALARHPLLSATIAGGNARSTAGHLAWAFASGPVEPYLDVADEDAPPRYPRGSSRLDLTTEPGLRLFLRGSWLWIQVHHASVDAIGATQYLEDLLFAYATISGAPESAQPLDPSLLAGRGRFHDNSRARRHRLARELHRCWLYFTQFPRAFAPARGEPVPRSIGPAQFPATAAHAFIAADLAELRSEAHRHGATVNDLLLADLFRTLDAWNVEHDARRHLRIAMPINMRLGADRAMPAANVVSMCFLVRKGAALEDRDLLSGVARETRAIKHFRLGHALLRVASTLGRIPSGLKLLMTPRRPWLCSASAVLSNLGAPFAASALPRDAEGRVRAGPLVLRSLELLPPIRPETRAAIGIVHYAGELAVTLHADARWLSSAAARALLNAYVTTLRHSMAAAAAANQPFAERLAASKARRGSEPFRALPIGKNVGFGKRSDALRLSP